MLSTPRSRVGVHRLTGSAWPQYREEHLVYFSPRGSPARLPRAGFTIEAIRPTTKAVTLAYLYGQAVAYPVRFVTPALVRTWRYVPVPRHRPFRMRFGEMTVVTRGEPMADPDAAHQGEPTSRRSAAPERSLACGGT